MWSLSVCGDVKVCVHECTLCLWVLLSMGDYKCVLVKCLLTLNSKSNDTFSSWIKYLPEMWFIFFYFVEKIKSWEHDLKECRLYIMKYFTIKYLPLKPDMKKIDKEC